MSRRLDGGEQRAEVPAFVVLMAYGSPERLEDVPAYYADIRGGRPIRPELLDDLTERYRRLGIEDSNPLNAITEATRAALEAELGLPVFTGMKHWTPRIADAVEAALATGADRIVGLVLAPHYSRLSIGGYREQLEDALAGRAELAFVESWHDDPGFVELLADRVRGTEAHVVFTAHTLPARILDEGDPYQEQLLETSRVVAGRRPERLVVLVPVRVADRRARGSSRTSSTTWPRSRAGGHRRPRLPGRLRRRPPRDPLGSRHRGGRRARRELGLRLARIEMPNADPAFIRVLAGDRRRALAVPSTV